MARSGSAFAAQVRVTEPSPRVAVSPVSDAGGVVSPLDLTGAEDADRLPCVSTATIEYERLTPSVSGSLKLVPVTVATSTPSRSTR